MASVPSSRLQQSLSALLQGDKAITIYQAEDGLFMISSSNIESNEDGPIFVPENTMLSRQPLEEAFETFYQHQQMLYVENFVA